MYQLFGQCVTNETSILGLKFLVYAIFAAEALLGIRSTAINDANHNKRIRYMIKYLLTNFLIVSIF